MREFNLSVTDVGVRPNTNTLEVSWLVDRDKNQGHVYYRLAISQTEIARVMGTEYYDPKKLLDAKMGIVELDWPSQHDSSELIHIKSIEEGAGFDPYDHFKLDKSVA